MWNVREWNRDGDDALFGDFDTFEQALEFVTLSMKIAAPGVIARVEIFMVSD